MCQKGRTWPNGTKNQVIGITKLFLVGQKEWTNFGSGLDGAMPNCQKWWSGEKKWQFS
jgi:hypothetical protein